MRVKVELELEVITDYKEIAGCTEENFKEHIKYILTEQLLSDNVGDLDYVSVINNITFPEGDKNDTV